MIPIQTYRNDRIIDIQTGEFFSTLSEICSDHKKTNRALAFAFLLFNDRNPQVVKILKDIDYWRALNSISGKYISVFYVPQQTDNYFAEDLENYEHEYRNLFEVRPQEQILPILRNYFKLEQRNKLPSVLFFQEDNGFITDYFLLSLDEMKIEDSFIELQTFLQSAVDRLERVKKEYYNNSSEIFALLKVGVENQKLKRSFFKITKKFPTQLLLGWIASKI